MANEILGTYHLSDNKTYRAYQPAKGNFFEIQVDNFKDLLKAGVNRENPGEEDMLTNCDEAIRLAINKAGIPHFELRDIEVRKGNSVVHYAGVPTFNQTTIEVDDMVGLQTKAVLEAWQALAYDVKTDKGGRARDYKRDVTLIEYTSDYVQVRSWTLKGCWIMNISESDYDKESDDLRRLSATIRYDRAIPEFSDMSEYVDMSDYK